MRIAALLLFSVATLAASQDCDQFCAEQNANVIREKDELWHSREAIIREKDEIWHSREAIIREKDEIWHSREAIIREKDEFFHRSDDLAREVEGLRNELNAAIEAREQSNRELGGVEELRASLVKQQEETNHYQQVARENEQFVVDYKNELATQRDTAAKLDIALKEANKKIEDIENSSIGKKIALGLKSFVAVFSEKSPNDKPEF